MFLFCALAFVVVMLKTCSLAALELSDGHRPLVAEVSTLADRPYNNESATNMGGARKGRKFLGKIGFLAGLHVGSGISSSGSLAASHSVKVFGKVMNTALSVSYGPARGPEGPGGPGPILHDPLPTEDIPATGKPVPLPTLPSLPEEIIQNKMLNTTIEEPQDENIENRQEGTEDNEVIVEEVEPPPTPTKRTLFQYLSRRQASIEQKPKRDSTSTVDRHRIDFLKDHHRHIATFNQHFQKLSGDVSKVVRIAGG